MKISREEFKQRLQANLVIHFEELVADYKVEGWDYANEATIVAMLPEADIQPMIQLMHDEGFELEHAASICIAAAVSSSDDAINDTGQGLDIDFDMGQWQSS